MALSVLRASGLESADTRALSAWDWYPCLKEIVEDETPYTFQVAHIKVWTVGWTGSFPSPKALLGMPASQPMQLVGWNLSQTMGALGGAAILMMSS